MSNLRGIAKNFIALSLAQVVSIGLSLVLVILITHFLGDAGYGKLGFAMSLASVLTVLTPLGLDSLMIREVARNKAAAAKYMGNVLVIELILAAISFGLIVLVAAVMRLPSDTAAVLYISGGYSILTIISGTVKCIFRAHEKMEYDAALNSIRSIVTMAAGAAVMLLGWGLLAVTYAYLLAAIVDLVLTLAITKRHFVLPKLEIDLSFWRQIIPAALPFAALALVAVAYGQSDIIILRTMQNDAVVGWYKAALVLATTFGVIPGILSTTLFPVMSRFHVSSKEALKLTVQKSIKYLLILGFPIATGIMLLSEHIIYVFYGLDFAPAIPALRLLAIYIPFSFLNAVLGLMLSSTDEQRLRFFLYLASTLVRIALNLFLVSRLSLTGAAVAILVSEALLFALNYYYSARHIPNLNILSIMFKPLLASAGMAALVFLLRDLNLFLVVILAAIAYFAFFLALKGFDADDRAMMQDVWKGMRGRREN